MDLVAKILRIHKALDRAAIPHAFGGALALAWCTERARGTIDIDINLLLGESAIESVLRALPKKIQWEAADVTVLRRDLQCRLWWDHTPVDLFFNSTPYHEQLAERIRWEQFSGVRVPFLSCEDLAVFKVFFDRTKDWADIEAMADAGTLDFDHVSAVIVELLGPKDHRLRKLNVLRGSPV